MGRATTGAGDTGRWQHLLSTSEHTLPEGVDGHGSNRRHLRRQLFFIVVILIVVRRELHNLGCPVFASIRSEGFGAH